MCLRRTMGLFQEGENVSSSADLAAKDIRLGVELGKELGVPLELSPLVDGTFTRFCDEGHEQEDQLEIMREFMRQSGVDVPKTK